MTSEVFEVSIKQGHSVEIPAHIAKPFIDEGHKRVKVEAAHQGTKLTFHAALQQYRGRYVMTFGKRYQKELGVFPNDYFQFRLFEDDSEYGVEIPEEMEEVLHSDQEAYKIFKSLTDGRKRSIIYMISRYKTSQTRIDKSLCLCENLKRGIRDQRQLLKSG